MSNVWQLYLLLVFAVAHGILLAQGLRLGIAKLADFLTRRLRISDRRLMWWNNKGTSGRCLFDFASKASRRAEQEELEAYLRGDIDFRPLHNRQHGN